MTDRNAAEKLRGQGLVIPASSRRDLGPDEFWPDELVGLDVIDGAGTVLGRVKTVETGFSQDRLIVATEDGEFIVPLVSELVPEIDVAGGRVMVELPEGLTD